MTWDSTLPIMVRSAIGDFDPVSPKYSDEQLIPVILTAAQGVLFTITPVKQYTVDIENEILTPDPTVSDPGLSYLITLKASSMLLFAEVRLYGQQAIAIRDGTSAIDLKRDLKALTDLAKSYEKSLILGLGDYYRNFGLLPMRSIVSPYKTLLSNLDGYFNLDRRSCR